MKVLNADNLVCLDSFETEFPIKVDILYQSVSDLNPFGKIYHNKAKLWLHEDYAKVVLLASLYVNDACGGTLVVYDGLRTTDAQAVMNESAIVKANPQWLESPRLLSPPGRGGHPRGMAADVYILDANGKELDMGTPIDFLASHSDPEQNPAHRNYPNLSEEQKQNRALLDDCMIRAAKELEIPLAPLPQEWWDFRAPNEFYNQFAPLADNDLPGFMRMVSTKEPTENQWQEVLQRSRQLAQEVLAAHSHSCAHTGSRGS